jgi:hypothetical protein
VVKQSLAVEDTSEGRVKRKAIVGTVVQYRTKAAAQKACESLRTNINREVRSPRTIADLVTHYKQKELPEDGDKSFSTRTALAFTYAIGSCQCGASTHCPTCERSR